MSIKQQPRILTLGEIEEENINNSIYYILKLNEEEYKRKNPLPIKIIINSKGGDINCAFGLIDVINNSNIPIHGYVYGQAMSAALPIFVSCHKKYMSKNSTLMYHNISWGIDDTLTTHTRELIEGQNMMNIFDKIIIEKTSLTKKHLDKVKRENRNQYYNAKHALELNIIDYII